MIHARYGRMWTLNLATVLRLNRTLGEGNL